VSGATVYLFSSPVYAVNLDENLPILGSLGIVTTLLLTSSYSTTAASVRDGLLATREPDYSSKKTKEEKAALAEEFESGSNAEAAAWSLFVNNFLFVAAFFAVSQYGVLLVPSSVFELQPLHTFVASTLLPSFLIFLRAKQII
jgi:hypothetical protein